MKRLELRMTDETYESIWQIHAKTKKSLNQIINELVLKGLEGERK